MCKNATIHNTVAANNFDNTDVNFKLVMKVGGQMEDSMLAKAVIIENHRKPRGYEKKTFKKRADNMKANGSFTVPRLQEPSSEKLGTTRLVRKMTFGTTKDEMITIKDCTNIKARPSIKQNEVQARVDVRAETREI